MVRKAGKGLVDEFCEEGRKERFRSHPVIKGFLVHSPDPALSVGVVYSVVTGDLLHSSWWFIL